MAVDIVRRAPEQLGKGGELGGDFAADDLGIEPAQQACSQQSCERKKCAAVERTKIHGQRMERRGQRDVQADRTRRVRGCRLQRVDLFAPDRGAHHHHRGGIETPAFDQRADAAIDARAEAVVIGAQPDAARRRLAHSAAFPTESVADFSGSALFTVCSAMK